MMSANGSPEEQNQDLLPERFLQEIALSKPGRKPINGCPMTSAERNRNYRRRKKEAGYRAMGGRDYLGCSYVGVDQVKPTFIGLDGESVEVEGQADKYILLAASNGAEIVNWEHGLSTKDCLDFLLALSDQLVVKTKNRAPDVRFLWFGSSYDVNMMLKDLPNKVLKRLWKYKTARWWPVINLPGRYYCISWTSGKRFSISLKEGKGGKKDKIIASFTSYDVFGFAQEGFVKAALGWQILKENDENIAFLQEMKGLRGSFSKLASTQEGRERIRKYNRMEVDILAEMGKMIWETHKRLGLALGCMHGAGATASLLLNKYNISEHINNRMPEPVRDHVLRAYLGGRVQLTRLGRSKEVYGYDLHSAYPWAARQLPSLKGSRWYHVEEFDPRIMGVWHVRWDCSAIGRLLPEQRHMIYPFPFRTENGHILWAQQGEGWYWTPEVETALRYFPGLVEVFEGDALYLPNANIRPFEFINDHYEERRRLKDGPVYDITEKVIKLGLNALYGKLAEGGHKYGSETAKVRLPKHQSYIYAGMITSTVRATMLTAAMISPRDVIAFATDCIFSRVDLGLPLSEDLGGWEGKVGYDALFLQPGVYLTHDLNEKVKTHHNRGFLPSEFDWERVNREWDGWPDTGSRFYFPSRRFIGLGAALTDEHAWPGKWQTWQTGNRELSPLSARQFISPHYADSPEEQEKFGPSSIVGMLPGTGISFPYSPQYEWVPGEAEYLDNAEFLAQPELFD